MNTPVFQNVRVVPSGKVFPGGKDELFTLLDQTTKQLPEGELAAQYDLAKK